MKCFVFQATGTTQQNTKKVGFSIFKDTTQVDIVILQIKVYTGNYPTLART